jgi:hypothetical protein
VVSVKHKKYMLSAFLVLISALSAYFSNDLFTHIIFGFVSLATSIVLSIFIVRLAQKKKQAFAFVTISTFVGQWWITQGIVLFLWLGLAWKIRGYHP